MLNKEETIFLVKADGREWTTIIALCSTRKKAEIVKAAYEKKGGRLHETLMIQEWQIDSPISLNDEEFL